MKKFDNIASLQAFNLIKFTSFLLISIFLTKSHLTTNEIGNFELVLFVANIVSYFWMTGLIQSFLPLYNNNAAFPGEKINKDHKSPEIFNAFLLIAFFSFCIFLLGHSIKSHIFVYKDVVNLPNANILLIYILLSNPAHFVEYIYLLRNKSNQILNYAIITYTLQIALVIVPVMMGYGVREALLGLVVISIIRLIWLFVLMNKYAEFKVSIPFMKDHISVGLPLVLSTLLSGSAQYIDGLIVALKFDSRGFALFRYGAKELPFVIYMAVGLGNAILPDFSNQANVKTAIHQLKVKSRRLMHFLFPLTIVVLLFSDMIFAYMFNRNFLRSSDVFMVYLLLIMWRMIFPNTILIGLKKTKIVMYTSIVIIIINVILSLSLIRYYGLVGVALASVIVMGFEKIFLVLYNYFKLKIKPQEYIPVPTYLIYSALLIVIFVLIDRRIIQIMW